MRMYLRALVAPLLLLALLTAPVHAAPGRATLANLQASLTFPHCCYTVGALDANYLSGFQDEQADIGLYSGCSFQDHWININNSGAWIEFGINQSANSTCFNGYVAPWSRFAAYAYNNQITVFMNSPNGPGPYHYYTFYWYQGYWYFYIDSTNVYPPALNWNTWGCCSEYTGIETYDTSNSFAYGNYVLRWTQYGGGWQYWGGNDSHVDWPMCGDFYNSYTWYSGQWWNTASWPGCGDVQQ